MGELYRVLDFHGRRIRLESDREGGYAARALRGWEVAPLFVCRLRVGGAIVHIAIPTSGANPTGTPLFETLETNVVAIRHPLSGLYISAPPYPEDAGRVFPNDRMRVQDWERFFLEKVEDDNPQRNVFFRFAQSFLESPTQADIILQALAMGDLVTVQRLMFLHHHITETVFDEVAARLIRDRTTLDPFIGSHVEDLYLARALLPLLEALRDETWRKPAEHLDVGSEYDFLNASSWGTRTASFWHGLNAAVRRGVLPQRSICIVATMRNEAIYILDWVAHYVSLGVEHFFVYTNDNDDGSNAILAALASTGIVTVLGNDAVPGGQSVQNKAYAHALSVLLPVLDFSWCGIVDADEFVAFDPSQAFRSLTELLTMRDFSDVDALVLHWATIGSGTEYLSPPEVPLTLRCKRMFDDEERVVKTFSRPARFIHSSPHVPAGGGTSERHLVTADGRPFSTISQVEMDDWRIFRAIGRHFTGETAVVCHYFYKSAAEYLWKFARNRGDYPKTAAGVVNLLSSEFAAQYLAQIDKPSSPSWPSQTNAAALRTRDGLLANAAVSDAHQAALKCFAERCERLAETYRTAAGNLSAEVRTLLDIANFT